jgi:hypothetical protein
MLSSSLSIALIGSSLGGPGHFYVPPLFSTAKGVTSSFLSQYGIIAMLKAEYKEVYCQTLDLTSSLL